MSERIEPHALARTVEYLGKIVKENLALIGLLLEAVVLVVDALRHVNLPLHLAVSCEQQSRGRKLSVC